MAKIPDNVLPTLQKCVDMEIRRLTDLLLLAEDSGTGPRVIDLYRQQLAQAQTAKDWLQEQKELKK